VTTLGAPGVGFSSSPQRGITTGRDGVTGPSRPRRLAINPDRPASTRSTDVGLAEIDSAIRTMYRVRVAPATVGVVD
jgi:hypothetical protein